MLYQILILNISVKYNALLSQRNRLSTYFGHARILTLSTDLNTNRLLVHFLSPVVKQKLPGKSQLFGRYLHLSRKKITDGLTTCLEVGFKTYKVETTHAFFFVCLKVYWRPWILIIR